ncbi:insulin receptor substrate 1 [Parasteatoda tepidariorum]|uniref:insulin receptor substrate 1 n=1 Tax=Parasteatoda tepidariorum TaxID=114398 RepID=UPI00077F94F7|nr:insulin receptor substrate 1 [Parasteatoda tepidariorum]XP_015906871.1 insulin receptor substrate 1 [Parasteatoda tepidariorum]
MSQKYKSFSKGRTLDLGSTLPLGVKRVGYLKKLKKMKKRFFVLHMDARLEYYSSEKKWKFGCEPRRCIDLKMCLNVSRKLHSKQKNIIAFYTQCDCFAVVADSTQELEDWLKDIVEVHKSCVEGDDNSRLVYEHLWQVIIDKHDLEYDKLLAGPYRVALTPKSLFLIKMNPLGENDYLEFPLMSIRRCGHSKDHFFIELGRSAVTGAGEIYMATEATIVAQNMHETVLSAMKSSKIREDPRPRSASSSENSNPHPIGVPQAFSNSRERCDSLPTRPQTIMGDNFSSSPYTSVGCLSKDVNSRPHSMYEWPSVNSQNSIFSPGSLSGGNSSTENVNRQQALNYNPYSLLSCSNSSPGRQTTETKNDYLKMSPSSEKSNPFDYISMKKSSNSSLTPSDYVDMKASHKSGGSLKKNTYMTMAHGGASDEEPVIMQAGYMDMSPSNSLPNSSEFNERLMNFHHNTKNDKELLKSYELEKVLSLLQVEDTSKNISDSFKNKPPLLINNISSISVPLSPHQNSCNSEATFDMKPPIPDRTYCKNEHMEDSLQFSKKELNPIIQKKKVKLGDVFHQDSVLHAPNNLCSEKSKANTYGRRDEVEKVELSDVNKNPCSENICDNLRQNCKSGNFKETLSVEPVTHSGDYVNINLEKNGKLTLSENVKHKSNPLTFYPCDPNYSNIQFGKQFCPLPNPNIATSDNSFSTSSIKSSQSSKYEDLRAQNVLKPPLAPLYSGPETAKSMAPMLRNIPNTLPAFRKQMSAPAGPLSLQAELPSPGRKSSCPVTASTSMSPAYVTRPMHLQSAHLRVSASKSPDHSSVSSVSSASDEISSAHSSPKILSTPQNFGAIEEVTDSQQYENVVIPQRPPSACSEKELNYASLDLAPPSKKETIVHKPDREELTYAVIDFTKSEGLKNTSGSLREGGRL